MNWSSKIVPPFFLIILIGMVRFIVELNLNKMDEKSDYILKFITMHPDLNMPIHMASDKFTVLEVDAAITNLVDSGHLYFDNDKYPNDTMVKRAVLTEYGKQYVDRLQKMD